MITYYLNYAKQYNEFISEYLKDSEPLLLSLTDMKTITHILEHYIRIVGVVVE